MSSDLRSTNWRFVVPDHDGRVLLLPVDGEGAPGTYVPRRESGALTAVLQEGPFDGIMVGDLAQWSRIAGSKTTDLLAGLAAAVGRDGWLYAAFPNRWFPGRPVRPGSLSARAVTQVLHGAGLTTTSTYFALPSQSCPAYLISADRRAELDYFLHQLFFPHASATSPSVARCEQIALNCACWAALRSPHTVRRWLGPAMAVVATRKA